MDSRAACARVKSHPHQGVARPRLAAVHAIRRAAVVRHLETIAEARRGELRGRYELLAAFLRSELPDWRWETPSGGASVWIDVGRDADGLAGDAARNGVTIIPGKGFLSSGASARHIRIAFSRPEKTLRAALERLAAVTLTR